MDRSKKRVLEQGQGLVEYALLLIMVAVVVIIIVALFVPALHAEFDKAAHLLTMTPPVPTLTMTPPD